VFPINDMGIFFNWGSLWSRSLQKIKRLKAGEGRECLLMLKIKVLCNWIFDEADTHKSSSILIYSTSEQSVYMQS
jgi:hypothetical protein